LEAQTTKGLGGKEPNMLIIDSLLQFNFFLSGEVQENLSLFADIVRDGDFGAPG
jgi:hypothetical protein